MSAPLVSQKDVLVKSDYKDIKEKNEGRRDNVLERKRKRIRIKKERIAHVESTWRTGIEDLENQITNFSEN